MCVKLLAEQTTITFYCYFQGGVLFWFWDIDEAIRSVLETE